MLRRLLAAATLLLAVALTVPAAAAPVDYVVDGDTIRLRSGVYVRLIGIDTPEVGQCGYRAAKRKLDRWVGGQARLVNPAGVDDRDGYDRLLRYVHDSGRDTGLALIRLGLAKARYDGIDGYDRHPRQAAYRDADRRSRDLCRAATRSVAADRSAERTQVSWDDYEYPRLYARPGQVRTFRGELFYDFRSQRGRVVKVQHRLFGTTVWVSAGRTTANRDGEFKVAWTAPAEAGGYHVRLKAVRTRTQPAGVTTTLQEVRVEPLVASDELADDLAAEINRVRASGATCAGDWVRPSVPAYRRDARLDSAAEKWADRIAEEHLEPTHESPEGEHVDERVEAEQYDWWSVGENIGTFYATAPEAVQQWFGDHGHCDLVMSDDYTDFGVGHGYDAGSEHGHYWVLVVGTQAP